MLVYACLRACVRVSEMLEGGGYSCVTTGHTVFVSVVSNRHQLNNINHLQFSNDYYPTSHGAHTPGTSDKIFQCFQSPRVL